MGKILVNFDKILGRIKPLHCVNNGPAATSLDSL